MIRGVQMLQSRRPGCALSGFDDTSLFDDEFPAPRLRTVRDCVVVELFGEIDISAFHRLAPWLDAVAAEPCRVVVVDLTGTTFLDCSGLRLLVRAAHRARERDGRLTVVCRHRLTLRLIDMGGLTDLLTPAWTVGEAVRRDRQPAG